MTDTTTTKTSDERKYTLSTAVNAEVARGWRVESHSDFSAVLVKGRRPNHLLHFVIGVVTISFWWWLVWLPLVIFGGEKRRTLSVDPYGNTLRS